MVTNYHNGKVGRLLKDLKAMIMVLSEIVRIAPQVQHGIPFDQVDWSTGQQVDHAEQMPLYRVELQGLTIFYIPGEQFPKAAIVGHWAKIQGSVVFGINRTYTDPKFRNQGLMTAMYRTLVRRQRITLVSDIDLAPYSVKIWQTLAQRHTVKVFDTATGEMSGEVTPRDISSELDGSSKTKYLVCTETIHVLTTPIEIFDIMLDYVHYTAEENRGLYP